MPEKNLDELDLVPHPERVSDEYADERIEEKVRMYEDERPREGLRNLNRALKDADVPAAYRLHYISTLAYLGRLGAALHDWKSLHGSVLPGAEHEDLTRRE